MEPSQKVRNAHVFISDLLEQAASVLPRANYRLTLVGRYIGQDKADADIIITDDELKLVAEAILSLQQRTEHRDVKPGEVVLADPLG